MVDVGRAETKYDRVGGQVYDDSRIVELDLVAHRFWLSNGLALSGRRWWAGFARNGHMPGRSSGLLGSRDTFTDAPFAVAGFDEGHR
jgi:hypothetical protein